MTRREDEGDAVERRRVGLRARVGVVVRIERSCSSGGGVVLEMTGVESVESDDESDGLGGGVSWGE